MEEKQKITGICLQFMRIVNLKLGMAKSDTRLYDVTITFKEQKMRSIKVFFANGAHLSTNINGTREEILAYYIGNEFNLGECGNDLMTKAIRVEFLE